MLMNNNERRRKETILVYSLSTSGLTFHIVKNPIYVVKAPQHRTPAIKILKIYAQQMFITPRGIPLNMKSSDIETSCSDGSNFCFKVHEPGRG